MSYLDFYGLAESPFSLTSDPRYLYDSRAFARAWTAVAGAVERREGVVVITGERGAGKSLLCRAFIEHLGPDTLLSSIADPRIGADDFLRQILADFGAGGDEALETFLASHTADAPALVLIDEAQHLSLAVFEQIKLLNNLETANGRRVQVLLVGPPELHSRLHQPLLKPLRQRVSCWADLPALDADEVGPYIARRLDVARADWAFVEFTPSAIEAIAVAAQGNPRLVNVIADRALVIGFTGGVRSIDRQIAAAAIARSGLEAPRSIVTPMRLAAIAALLALLAVVALALWPPSRGRPAPAEQPAAAGERPSPAIEPPSRAIEPPPAPSRPSDGVLAAADSHLVVVGSFENAERAAEVVRELSARGLPAFTRLDATANSYAVMVGPYVSREEAVEVEQVIKALRYPDARIAIERP